MTTIPSDAEFQKIIIEYFDSKGRHFPWRETNDPYKILVSEIMLQQTQTERVIKKYDEWLENYPSVKEAALAPLSDILLHWNGLGYNRRAGYLHDACKEVYLNHSGVFPSTAAELKKLSGVGTYTSCAVSCFAYNNPEVFIETNIRSVYLFFFFPDEDLISDVMLMPLIERTLYKENPRIWYYALMDYGAELKKKVKNPNRKSAHYLKQSKFSGSLREARGALLRQLVRNPEGLLLSDIGKRENIEYERLENAAVKLVCEGYIHKREDLYYINN